MKDKEKNIYSIRELIPEIIGKDTELDANIRKAYRYYEAYKKMECVMDLVNGSDQNIYAEDKDMIVRNMKKIWENYDYMKFVNKAQGKNFSFAKFLKLVQNEKNREIFEDLYLSGLYELDKEFHGFTKKDIYDYVEKVNYEDISEKMKKMIEELELLMGAIFSIKDKANRNLLIENLSDSMEENAKKVMEYRNRENYINRIAKVVPELRLVTRVENLPESLFREYIRHNGFESLETLGKTKYDVKGFPQDNITDEIIKETVEKYYEKQDHSMYIERIMGELEERLCGKTKEDK